MKKDFLIIGDYAIKVAFVLGLIYLFYDIFSVFFPIVLAVFIALVLQPLVNKIAKQKIFGRTIPRGIVIVFVLFMLAALVATVFIFIVKPLLTEISNLMTVLPGILWNMKSVSITWMEYVELWNVPESLRHIIEQLLSSASSYILGFLQSMLRTTFELASNILGVVVLPFLVYYFIKDGNKFSASALRLLPPIWRPKARAIIKESAYTISAYTRGIVIVGTIAACVVWLGTYTIGLDYPYVFALLAAMGEAIPFVGAIFSIPALFFALLQGPDVLLVAFVFYATYHTFFGYVLSPSIQGKYLKMHPVIIIVSILIAGRVAGVLGMFFAVPAAAFIRILFKHIVTHPREVSKEMNENEGT